MTSQIIFTDFYSVVVALRCMYFIFLIYIYICWLIIYLFPLFPELLKSCCLVRICLNVQLPDVFWATVNSLDTDKYLLYDFPLIFWCLLVWLPL